MLKNQSSYNFTISLPNSKTIQDHHSGNVPLDSFNIGNVLHIPSFKINLLSASQLTKSLNYLITFYPTHCVLYDLVSRTIIGQGEEKRGLYLLQPITILPIHACLNISICDTWHKWFGHPSSSWIKVVDKYLQLNLALNKN